jgi:hypothetical protein
MREKRRKQYIKKRGKETINRDILTEKNIQIPGASFLSRFYCNIHNIEGINESVIVASLPVSEGTDVDIVVFHVQDLLPVVTC